MRQNLHKQFCANDRSEFPWIVSGRRRCPRHAGAPQESTRWEKGGWRQTNSTQTHMVRSTLPHQKSSENSPNTVKGRSRELGTWTFFLLRWCDPDRVKLIKSKTSKYTFLGKLRLTVISFQFLEIDRFPSGWSRNVIRKNPDFFDQCIFGEKSRFSSD